jgi:hypothetical protein
LIISQIRIEKRGREGKRERGKEGRKKKGRKELKAPMGCQHICVSRIDCFC